ncbi:MAG: T9SS type A sorting domain-containing protein [Bacteroidetes bacterium]|nr:T9SS type A sorting domain-containing protein [Bacteroidota bacterium]
MRVLLLLFNAFLLLQITTPAQQEWFQQSSGTANLLYGISFTDTNNGTAVGDLGTILRTTNGGVTFIKDENNFTQPKDFLLSQNSPNPFNPSTTIRFSIPEESFVTIKVFNTLGKEITTLINENIIVGNYEIEFIITTLPSGIYFYQLQAGNFVETKKMVLMK